MLSVTLFVLVSMFSAHLLASGPSFVFKAHGKEIKSMELSQFSELVKPEEVEVFDPDIHGKMKFRAYSVEALLGKVAGPNWKNDEMVLFTCSDGYQPGIPMEQFKKYKAYLAFERVDQKEFSLVDQNENNQKIDLAPLYLVWDNLDHREILGTNGAFWPFKLVGLDLTTFRDQYPKIYPLKGASASAKRGFLIFQRSCLNCHSINGQGGSSGPELNYPKNVTEYWSAKVLREWILKPSSVRLRSMMPPLVTFVPENQLERSLDDIVAYLRAMKENKTKSD